MANYALLTPTNWFSLQSIDEILINIRKLWVYIYKNKYVNIIKKLLIH